MSVLLLWSRIEQIEVCMNLTVFEPNENICGSLKIPMLDGLEKLEHALARYRTSKAVRSGTTIIAFTYHDGVLMAADRQTSAGFRVWSPEAVKIHMVSPMSLWGAAGLVAYIQETHEMLMRLIDVFENYLEKELPISAQGKLLNKILQANASSLSYLGFLLGYVAVPILAGWDTERDEPKIFAYDDVGGIYDVTERTSQFATVGSGGESAESVLQDRWTNGINEEAAIRLAIRALLRAGEIDLGTSDARIAPVTLFMVRRGSHAAVSLSEQSALQIAYEIFQNDLRGRKDPRSKFFVLEQKKGRPVNNHNKKGGAA